MRHRASCPPAVLRRGSGACDDAARQDIIAMMTPPGCCAGSHQSAEQRRVVSHASPSVPAQSMCRNVPARTARSALARCHAGLWITIHPSQRGVFRRLPIRHRRSVPVAANTTARRQSPTGRGLTGAQPPGRCCRLRAASAYRVARTWFDRCGVPNRGDATPRGSTPPLSAPLAVAATPSQPAGRGRLL